MASNQEKMAKIFKEFQSESFEEFNQQIQRKGQVGLYKEYESIRNMYIRPKMSNHASAHLDANFVDGINRPKAYILTEQPSNTKEFLDFWQMVWTENVMSIVNLKKTDQFGRYWPRRLTGLGNSLTVEKLFVITAKKIETYDDYLVTDLELKHIATGDIHQVTHFQFLSWPEFDVPTLTSILPFLQKVHQKQTELMHLTHSGTSPIVIHCRSGIGRTGTFTALDMVINKFEIEGKINIRATVENLRSQRPYSVETSKQYAFVHLAFMQYVLNKGYTDQPFQREVFKLFENWADF